jgi:DNA-binding IclR family transcriptional regulator
VDEAGSDYLAGFEARTNIRRTLLVTAGGKALLATLADTERDGYLRRQSVEHPELVDKFLAEYDQIRRTRIATNLGQRSSRFGIATTVCNRAGQAVASVTLVGPTAEAQSRQEELGKILLEHVTAWSQRAMSPREAI